MRLFTTLAPILADLLLFLGYVVKGCTNLEDLINFLFTTVLVRVLVDGAGFPAAAGVAVAEVVVGVATDGVTASAVAAAGVVVVEVAAVAVVVVEVATAAWVATAGVTSFAIAAAGVAVGEGAMSFEVSDIHLSCTNFLSSIISLSSSLILSS